MGDLKNTDYLYGANSVFVEELYQRYLQNPSSVDETWRNFFSGVKDGSQTYQIGASWNKHPVKIIGTVSEEVKKDDKKLKQEPVSEGKIDITARAHMLIRAYRTRGHLLADLDPLNLEEKKTEKDLNLDSEFYGFSVEELGTQIYIGNEIAGLEYCTLGELIARLKEIYSNHIGVEFMHIQSLEEKEWIQDKIENLPYEQYFTNTGKKDLLKHIVAVEGFEQFLHIKFPGMKRFSVEGAENSITAVDAIIRTSAELGVKEIVLGMPHRGRLNVLTKVMGKPYYAMLSEFMGNPALPEELGVSGDVKYHLGTSTDKDINGHKVHMSLTANPSHLEAVNPVVVGKVRAKQDNMDDQNRSQVMGVLLHGDAAFAGQGLVAETLSLGDLAGYRTGGTAHIIVNNQIGFTTSPKKARLSRYPTEVGKIVQAPIFHVNGDDPEAVYMISKIAAEFRAKFQKDIIVDVICYRQYGHNETDEPMFTQPLMYKAINARTTPVTVYANNLVKDGVITQEDYENMKAEFRQYLDSELKKAEGYKPNDADWLAGKWSGLKGGKLFEHEQEKTGVKLDRLKKIGAAISKLPENFHTNSKLIRLFETKQKMIETGENLDWAMGELLAYATLLEEGNRVRLSGQDSGRGTFTHRHAVLVDQNNEDRYEPLNNISKNQARFEVIDSNLSEFAVLGYEYGYSTVEPKSLTLWEAQFGDFANGAQVIFDQFIASAEIKWLRMSGLVVLLPHGFEGQGPEHSSARLERFLQLCAEDNMQVVNCTTPANFFHVLRRQIVRNFRKPLIVMTPKSLLRHKLAVSKLTDMAEGTSFKPVYGEVSKLVSGDKVKRVIICSGKVYYDIFEEREKRVINDIAIVRVEEYYPFPEKSLKAEVEKYKNAEVIWCQEEPKNMGAWNYICHLIEDMLINSTNKVKRPKYIGRVNAASPAVGSDKKHKKEQAQITNECLTI